MKSTHIFASLSLLSAEALSFRRPAVALDMLTDMSWDQKKYWNSKSSTSTTKWLDTLHCNHFSNSLLWFFSYCTRQSVVLRVRMADGPFLSNILGWVMWRTEIYAIVLPSRCKGFHLSLLSCFEVTVHIQAIRIEACVQEMEISQTYFISLFFRGRRKQSYLLVSPLWKKLLRKLCTYYSPGVWDIRNAPKPEKAFHWCCFPARHPRL